MIFKIAFAMMVASVSFADDSDWIKKAKLPTPQIETLPNGLKVAWFLDEKAYLTDIAALFESGYRDDPKGKAGTAQLVSAVLDKGVNGQSAIEFARSVEKLAASRFVSAREDGFSVGVSGLSEDAPQLIGLLSQMVLKPDFPEEEIEKEKSNTLDSWKRMADYGRSLASYSFYRWLVSGTSYARGDFWNQTEYLSVSRSDLAVFHKLHFTPKNAILMVVGNVDQKSFKKKIMEEFGTWLGEKPERKFVTVENKHLIPSKKQKLLVVKRPGLNQAQVKMGFEAPLFSDEDHYPLIVANALIGEYFQSRLNSVIRDELALTYGIGSNFGYSKDFAYFTISSACRNEVVGQLIQKTQEILKKTIEEPIPEEEVQMAKEYLLGSFPLSTSTLGAVASRWLAGYIYDLGTEYLNEFIPKVSQVTAAQVQAALKKHFSSKKLKIVVAGDLKGSLEKSLKKHDLTPFKSIDAKDVLPK